VQIPWFLFYIEFCTLSTFLCPRSLQCQTFIRHALGFPDILDAETRNCQLHSSTNQPLLNWEMYVSFVADAELGGKNGDLNEADASLSDKGKAESNL
jgi:hypothetical protein